MKLKEFCKENNINCATCINSYWNYISENRRNLFCSKDNGRTDEDYICIHYGDEE